MTASFQFASPGSIASCLIVNSVYFCNPTKTMLMYWTESQRENVAMRNLAKARIWWKNPPEVSSCVSGPFTQTRKGRQEGIKEGRTEGRNQLFPILLLFIFRYNEELPQFRLKSALHGLMLMHKGNILLWYEVTWRLVCSIQHCSGGQTLQGWVENDFFSERQSHCYNLK